MSELALARRLARTRRRKPRPPMWWFCVAMVGLTIAVAVFDVLAGYWLYAGSALSFGAMWWRHLHSPPGYYSPGAFALWGPPGYLLLFAAFITSV